MSADVHVGPTRITIRQESSSGSMLGRKSTAPTARIVEILRVRDNIRRRRYAIEADESDKSVGRPIFAPRFGSRGGAQETPYRERR